MAEIGCKVGFERRATIVSSGSRKANTVWLTRMNYRQAYIDRRQATIHLWHNVDQKTGPSAVTDGSHK